VALELCRDAQHGEQGHRDDEGDNRDARSPVIRATADQGRHEVDAEDDQSDVDERGLTEPLGLDQVAAALVGGDLIA
jgi:hypothetical protein